MVMMAKTINDEIKTVNEAHFTLPSLPLSHNSLYQIIYSQRRVELKPECRLWKTESKQHVPKFKVGDGSLIEINVTFYYSFLYRNGKPRVFDAANLLKLLIDTVAEKCGFNDCLVRRGSWASIDSTDERVAVTLTEITSVDKGRLERASNEASHRAGE